MSQQFYEVITDEESVRSTICYLIDSRILCAMEFPGTQDGWFTFVLAMKRINRSQSLLIDRVEGFETALARNPDRKISLAFKDSGGVSCFLQTRVIQCGSGGIWCELPKSLRRLQRRQSFRVEAPAGTEILFTVNSAKPETGDILNLSGTGAAFRIKKGLPISVGDVLKDVQIRLPEEGALLPIAKAIIRRLEEDAGKLLGGLEFTEISEEARKQLISYIFKRHRSTIRKLGR